MYTYLKTWIPTCIPLNNICLLKFKGKKLAFGRLRVSVQLTIWKYHQVFLKNVFQTVKSVFHFFPSCWHLSSSSNKTKSFFHSPGSVLPHYIFCPAARIVASPHCQLFPPPTHFPPLLLYNTLHLCDAFLSRLSKFSQIYYLICLLDNFIIQAEPNPNLSMNWILKSHLDVGYLEPRDKIPSLDLSTV